MWKKKVGIMSMQRIKNYGSFLQAYALKEIIKELGYNVEFVDYHIEKNIIQNEKRNNKIAKIIEVIKCRGKLMHKIQYIIHKKNFGKKYYDILELTKCPKYNSKLDTLVIGSDEVFNCVQKNQKVGYSMELFGKNNKAKRLISYAASFGNTTLEKLEKYQKKEEIGQLLNEFDALSVRDENSKKIVSTLTGRKCIFNLDPVLIYDYMNKCEKISKLDIKEKYIIVYAYNGRISDEESKNIREFAKKNNYKIYSIGGTQECTDKFIDCSPFEVLAYFKNAEFVITDTFHGSIFSVITKRNFVTLVRKSVGNEYGNEEKLTDLLNRLKLQGQIIYDIKEIEQKLQTNLNYEETDKIICNERHNAYEYLKNNI